MSLEPDRTDRASSFDALDLPPQELLDLYRTMVEIRLFDEQVMDLAKEGLVRGTAHQYTGMEAIAVGACSGLDVDDLITSTHRGHGHGIAKGLEPYPMMAEILGRSTGYCRGRGGSMHITDVAKGMLGADGVVGGSSGIAVGAAHAQRLSGASTVVLSFFGDGASDQGAVHEAINLAAVLDAPVVFICENNGWALSTPTSLTKRSANIADRAVGYGIPGATVDGNDVLEVRRAVGEAVERARRGHGPTLVEAVTYRMSRHSAIAAVDLREPDEVERWRQFDPIAGFRRHLVDTSVAGEAELARIDDAAIALINDARERALADPAPDPEDALTAVYAPAEWNTEEAV